MNINTINNHVGYAIVPKGEKSICYTSAPEILGEGKLWQVYTNRKDAEDFLKIRFGDAEYEIAEINMGND